MANQLEINEYNKKKIKNKGTGAGGKNTNKSGKPFEELTNNEYYLYKLGAIKIQHEKYYYLYLYGANFDLYMFKQNAFKYYMKEYYNIDTIWHPDEAYVIYNKHNPLFCDLDKISTIKILEKKNQNVGGSVDQKLWASGYIKKSYQKTFIDTRIEYGLCLGGEFFIKKFRKSSDDDKYKQLKEILDEDNIPYLLYDDNYSVLLNRWIMKLN